MSANSPWFLVLVVVLAFLLGSAMARGDVWWAAINAAVLGWNLSLLAEARGWR